MTEHSSNKQEFKTLVVQESRAQKRQPWRNPAMKAIGSVGQVVKGGGGKLSITTNDTGDVRKPPGQG